MLIKNFVVFSLLFTLMYFETSVIGGVKFTLIWKVFFLVPIVMYLIHKEAYSISRVTLFGFLFAVKILFYNWNVAVHYEAELVYFVKIVSFLIILEFFRFKYQGRVSDLEGGVVKFAGLIILTTIPFLMGLVDAPVNLEENSLAKFGYAHLYEFVGVFGNKHNAAVTLAGALLVMISNREYFYSRDSKILYFFLISIGLIALYLTYVRTGYLVLFCGLSALYLWGGNAKQKLKYLPLIGFIFAAVYIVFQNSDILQMRILDKNVYTDSAGELGSGRLIFYQIGFSSFIDSSFTSIILGVGDGHAKDIMADYIGHRYASHSGFLDILRISGLLGFLFFIFFLISIFQLIINSSRSNMARRKLAALFVGYIAIMLVQGGIYFWFNVFLAVYIAIVYCDQSSGSARRIC